MICDSKGLECFRKLTIDKEECLIPCEGIFADIRKEKVEDVDEKTPGMKHIFQAYEKYKNEFQDQITYPQEISSIINKIFIFND